MSSKSKPTADNPAKGKINSFKALTKQPVHPAVDINSVVCSVGIYQLVDNKVTYGLLTDKGLVPPKVIKQINFKPDHISAPANFIGRYTGESSLTFACSVEALTAKFNEYVWLKDDRWYPVLALWTAGTYLHQAFLSYPYIKLAGERECGKTKILDILSATAFNPAKQSHITPATVFRIVESLRPTLLVDEVEQLSVESSMVLNTGYKKGGQVSRCNKDDNSKLEFFNSYSPKCFGSIESIGDTLEHRCLILSMLTPPIDDKRLNLEVDPFSKEWVSIRDGFYHSIFTYGQYILSTPSIAIPSWVIGRSRELWKPLFVLAAIVDAEKGDEVYTTAVTNLCKDLVTNKGSSYKIESIITILEELLGSRDEVAVRPQELVESFSFSVGKGYTPEKIANQLRNLGFTKAPRTSKGVAYSVGSKTLNEVKRRNGV